MIEKNLGDLINANCWAHCRRSFAEEVKPVAKEYFAWAKEAFATQIPKGKTAEGLKCSITETAKLNNLSTYNYFCHLLTELPKLVDNDRNIDSKSLEGLMP